MSSVLLPQGALILPLVSTPIAAGFPSPAADHEVSAFDLGEHLIRNRVATFVMRASGDSMRGAGILDGSLLVVDRSINPADGHIVVAALDGEHVVKYFRRRARRAWLQAAHPDYPDIELRDDADFIVFGVVTFTITSLTEPGHVRPGRR